VAIFWTVFYWAFWIALSPFAGMFIGRVSRGRAVRELVGGVLLLPTVLTGIWLTVFGGSALYLQLGGTTDIVAAVNIDTATAIYDSKPRRRSFG